MIQPVLYFTEDAKSAIRNALIQSIGNWVQYIVWRDKVTDYGIAKATFCVRDKHMFAINLLKDVGTDIIGWAFHRITLPPNDDKSSIDSCRKCDIIIRDIIFSDNEVIGEEGYVDIIYECVECKKDIPNVKIIDKPLVDLVSIGSIGEGRDIIHG